MFLASSVPALGGWDVLERLGDGVTHFELRGYAGRRVVTAELPKIDENLVASLSELNSVAAASWRR